MNFKNIKKYHPSVDPFNGNVVRLVRMGNSIRLKWGKICSKEDNYIRPTKNIGVFRVTGLKIVGWVGTLIVFFFLKKKNVILCILKGQFAFQNA